MSRSVVITVDGAEIEVLSGTSVAAAIAIAGVHGFRRAASGAVRGPVCGMGICFECRAEVDGVPGVRTCQLVCAENMAVRTANA